MSECSRHQVLRALEVLTRARYLSHHCAARGMVLANRLERSGDKIRGHGHCEDSACPFLKELKM